MARVSFVIVVAPAQPSPPHATAIKDMGEAPFDHLGAAFAGLFGDARQQLVDRAIFSRSFRDGRVCLR